LLAILEVAVEAVDSSKVAVAAATASFSVFELNASSSSVSFEEIASLSCVEARAAASISLFRSSMLEVAVNPRTTI
jgi:hypothetical protein